MKVAVEQIFDGSIQQVAIGGAYDATKINRGKHTGQFDLGAGQVDKFIGPAPVGAAHFGESPSAIPTPFVHAVKINNDLFWIFGTSAGAASATRPIQLWTFVPSTNTYSFAGFITLTFPSSGNTSLRGLRVILENYTTGTVGVSGTAVTGSGTAWTTGLSVGSRIGFGSTNPDQITTWYQISAIGSDTSITLTGSAGTISAGTPYVIQDLMVLAATNNSSTPTNGGLFVVKGLRYEDFAPVGTTIPAATTVDKIKAVYWLKDAATITNDVIGGCAVTDRDSWTQQYAYCTEGSATTLNIYRYNIRAPLSLTAGAATLTGSDMVITGAATVTGNISTLNNGRVATLNHGPGKGIPSLYMFTGTRVYRAALADIVSGSTTFLSDSTFEVPPGSATTNTPNGGTGAFVGLEIANSIDKIMIVTGLATGTMFYITDYYTGGQAFDRRAGCLSSQTTSVARHIESPIFLHATGSSTSIWVEDGWLFYVYSTASAVASNAVSAYPLAADWDFESKVPNRIICPKITLGESPKKLYRVLVNDMENLGSERFGIAPEAYKVQVRISGIDDNTGSWIDVPQNGDLSGLGATTQIQFGFEFRTIATILLPARVFSLALVYETEDELPPQYRWNFTDYNASNGTVGWVQKTLFGATPGTHTINFYRSDTNQLVLTQVSTGTTSGTFENWNGSAWVAGLGADTVGRRRRFVPSASLPASVDLYAEITVA
jgi:hypothetical protein